MSLQLPSGCVALDMARDGVINSKGDEMNITIQKDDFIVDKKGMSLFYYILQSLDIPLKERDVIDQVDVEVKSFETFREDE